VSDIPVVDIGPFRADPPSAAAATAVDALRDACHRVGFAYLVGHGVDQRLADDVLAVSRRFFQLPEPDRLEIVNTNTPYFRGYTRLGQEYTKGKPDRREQIDIGPERAAPVVQPGDPPWLRVRGPNQWPSALPELRPAVTEWMAQMAGLGGDVLRALALGLGQSIDLFDPVVSPDPEVLVKIIRYPGSPADDVDRQGVGLHHDSGLLTFIMQDDAGGLQVMHDGQLVDAPGRPGAYLLNLGEMLQLATDGYLRATPHRVVSPPEGRERVSVAYFFNPDMAATLAPVVLPPELAAEAPGGQNVNPDDPVLATYGDNWLKFRLRSHPDVAEIHHADLLTAR
jgi:isopenicillin N synthase-like dioxygenase